ncbi:MAG TPA: UMP kinase [archaeon]|nr:UMP kinase [archaeon]
MKGLNDKTIVVSVGGSLIVPDEIDVHWLGRFREVVGRYTEDGYRFVVVAGGGRTARKYQEAARRLTDLEDEDVDWIGIHSTRLNAHLLRAVFRDKAKYRIIKDPTEETDFKESVLIAAGWKPGFSTDYIAVLLAKNLGIKKLANLTNTDYVYDKDPHKNPDAKPIREIPWEDFRKLVGDRWDPGLNTPFDPIASREAEEYGMEVAILNGDLENFEEYLSGRNFKGTLIGCEY